MSNIKTGTKLRVLIECTNDATGQSFGPGDEVVAGSDFLVRVCQNWVDLRPPVLEVMGGPVVATTVDDGTVDSAGSDDGSDT